MGLELQSEVSGWFKSRCSQSSLQVCVCVCVGNRERAFLPGCVPALSVTWQKSAILGREGGNVTKGLGLGWTKLWTSWSCREDGRWGCLSSQPVLEDCVEGEEVPGGDCLVV